MTVMPPVIPVFMDLDALLNDSIKQKTEREQEVVLRRKVQRGIGSKEELAADAVLLRKWSTEREWQRAANVVSFSRQKCAKCGEFHTNFLGYFEFHINKRLANTSMHVAVKGFDLDLPREVHYVDSIVPLCHSCGDTDWPLED